MQIIENTKQITLLHTYDMHRYDIWYMTSFVLRKFLLRKCFIREHLCICESLTIQQHVQKQMCEDVDFNPIEAWSRKALVVFDTLLFSFEHKSRICKPFKEPRNRFLAWRAGTTSPARQAA